MRSRKRIAVWGEGVLAVAVALVTWAILVPNLGTFERLPNGRREFSPGNPPALVVYTAILIVLVATIIFGQRRSWILRLAGWALLLVFFVLELRL